MKCLLPASGFFRNKLKIGKFRQKLTDFCQPAAEKMPDGKMQKDSNRRGICQRSLSTLLTVQYNSDAETAGSQNHRRSSLSST